MQIFLISLTDKTIAYRVEPNDTIGLFKSFIHYHEGIPSELQD